MSFAIHMKGYDDLRTLVQTDRLYAWNHDLYFPPALIEINPTNRCNQQCRYCYTNKRIEPHETLRDDILVDSFAQVAEAGVRAVVVQGTGEPLMHGAIPAAIANGAARGLAIGLCTNGILLDDAMQENILPHLLYVRFSVVESDPRRYAYLHGCPEHHFGRLVKNIEAAVKRRNDLGLGLGLCMTVYLYKDNFHDIRTIVQFYKNLGVDYLFIQEATYSRYSPAGKQEGAFAAYSEKEISNMKDAVMALSDDDCRVKVKFPATRKSCPGGDTNWKKDFCRGIRFFSLISSDGGVYPCWRAWGKKEFCYGDLYSQRFEDIWKGDARKRIEETIFSTPPSADECVNCNNPKLNEILEKYHNANTPWKDFIL